MNSAELQQKISHQSLPLLIEIWAPWCMPCKMMQPYLRQLEQEYAGKIELMRINADENPLIIKELKVYGVPTLLGYRDQQLVFRRTGLHSMQQLQQLAEVLLGNKTSLPTLSLPDRLMRSIAGLALLWLGWDLTHSWLWISIGLLLLFSAVYDRCPIIQAIMRQIKK